MNHKDRIGSTGLHFVGGIAAVLACSALTADAAPYQTMSLVDIQAEVAAYVAKTNEAAKLCAAYDKEQRDWRTACNEAKKAGKEQPPAPTTKKPTPPHWIPCPIVCPEAEVRADEAVAEEKRTLPERQAAWDAAKEKYDKELKPAYDKAMAEYNAKMKEYQDAKRKDPKTPDPKLVKPTAPEQPSRWRPGNPRRVVKVNPATDTPCFAHPRERNSRFMRPVDIKTTGRYFFWIQHWQTANTHSALEFLLRNPDGECINYQLPDRIADMWTNTHADDRVFQPDRKGGMVWTKVEVDIEYPGEYRLYLSKNHRYVQRGMNVGNPLFAIRDIWVTNDPAADPTKGALKASDIPLCYEAPKGFVKAAYHAPNALMNSSIADPQKRPPTNLMECYSWFEDPARYLKYGVTDGLCMSMPIGKEMIKEYDKPGAELALRDFQGGAAVNASIQLNADAGKQAADILAKKYPFNPRQPVSPTNQPIGRVGWSDGSYSGGFSDSFQEYNDLYFELNKEQVKKVLANKQAADNAFCWWTAWEQCGTYDYGETSVSEWRKYLEKKYGTLAKLNEAWHTEYKSFGEITPAYWKNIFGNDKSQWFTGLKRHQAMANYADFRDFCSKAYATRIYQKTRAVREFDKKRHISSNLSCNNISSVLWMQWRPLVFEDTAKITMNGSDMIGYDNYGTDDLYGANYELFDAFGDGKLRPMIREGACHAPGAELQARTQWHNIAKGMQGQACFCVQEANVGELSKFGMSDMFHGATPRPKLAAFSDNFRGIHHLEFLISEAKRTRAVKPIAIYYSSICHLFNEKPYLSMFDTSADNFFRVYELLHAKGYAVTFVTDRQIREGGDWFKSLGAIVFVDSKYVPLDVMDKLIDWVKNDGGAVLADAQSCSADDHTFPTDKFTKFLGVQPVQRKKADDMAAEKLAFGYSAYSFDVVNSDDLWNTCAEIKDAPGGEHPISRELDKTMFSTFGVNEIKCVNGTQVMQNNNGGAFFVVRNEGKGTVGYVAGFLGQMFGAGLTTYEHTDAHGDDSPYRVLDAWAKWAGLKKIAVNDLPGQLSLGIRHESPLVDAKGNAMLGIVSQLRGECPSFRAKYLMPENFKAPKMVLATINSTRKVEKIPFAYDEKTRELSVRMCPFRCWGNVLALNDLQPLVSATPVTCVRDAHSLTWFKPGDEVTYRVKVFNPSPKALPAGKVQLRLSEGWFYDKEFVDVPSIPAYGESAEVLFTVKAPAFNSCRKLEPVNFLYTADQVVSSPAVEMVWFQTEPQEKGVGDFGGLK